MPKPYIHSCKKNKLSYTKNHIVVFEHESIRWDKGENKISKNQFAALEKYFGDGTPFYSLKYNGVKFNEHVGVIQVGNTLIEVLPKADNFIGVNNAEKENPWRSMLINMMRAVGNFDIKTTSESQLKVKPNSILDLYFYMFMQEVQMLLHTGLIKKYRNTQSNQTALKGNLLFAQQLQHNLVHQERFFVKHTTYGTQHVLHQLIYKALKLIKQISNNVNVLGIANKLLLDFPEMPDIIVTPAIFEKLILNRKSFHYKKAIAIAKLLLLQYHPDVSKGRNHVLALMFDMNVLWEQFVFVSLNKYLKDTKHITPQTTKQFWQPAEGNKVTIKPDIFIELNNNAKIILDTKWKNLDTYKPSSEDLRQMYVYHEYYNAEKVALVYPGANKIVRKGNYYTAETKQNVSNKECSLLPINIEQSIIQWQKNIADSISKWLNLLGN